MCTRKIIAVIAILTLCVACKTRERVVTRTEFVTAVDTVYETKWQYDSITLHDSIYIHQKGDTVYSERWRDRYRWRTRTDTMYTYKEIPKAVTDTIYEVKEVPVEKEVYRQHWWQKILSWLGGLVGAAGVTYIVTRFIMRK